MFTPGNAEVTNTRPLFRMVPAMAVLIACFALPCTPPASGKTCKPTSARQWVYLSDASCNPLKDEACGEKLCRDYSVIALAGFVLNRDGRLSRRPVRAGDVSKYAAKEGLRFFPVIAFSSAADGGRLLASDSSRGRAVQTIVECIGEYTSSGVHLDFEYLPPGGATDLSSFVGELREAVKARGQSLSVSMALFPQIEFPSKWAGFHNFELLAPLLDEAVLMCYDYHRKGTRPGPVVDIRWSERNIVYALKFFKAEQLWLGVPAYGYTWTGSVVEVVSSRTGVGQAERYGALRHESGTLYYEHRRGPEMQKAYIPDARTRKDLETLALNHGLRGTALWRLGLED